MFIEQWISVNVYWKRSQIISFNRYVWKEKNNERTKKNTWYYHTQTEICTISKSRTYSGNKAFIRTLLCREKVPNILTPSSPIEFLLKITCRNVAFSCNASANALAPSLPISLLNRNTFCKVLVFPCANSHRFGSFCANVVGSQIHLQQSLGFLQRINHCFGSAITNFIVTRIYLQQSLGFTNALTIASTPSAEIWLEIKSTSFKVKFFANATANALSP